MYFYTTCSLSLGITYIPVNLKNSIPKLQVYIQYRSKGMQHYTRVKHVFYTHITRSVHAPDTQTHENACNYTRVNLTR